MLSVWSYSAPRPGNLTNLAFFEDFNDTSGIDMDDTGDPGFNFYRRHPFGGGTSSLSSFSVGNSILTITPIEGDSNNNSSLWTSAGPNVGFAARGGAYFEAKIAFEERPPGATGAPAFWMGPVESIYSPFETPNLEVDFVEFFDTYFGTTIWYWEPGSPTVLFGGATDPGSGYNATQYHTYGFLWLPSDKMAVYVDGRLLREITYSEEPLLGTSDDHGWAMTLGSGEGWPMHVDWVKVWQ